MKDGKIIKGGSREGDEGHGKGRELEKETEKNTPKNQKDESQLGNNLSGPWKHNALA